MPDGNPLVAAPKDDTTAVTGIGIAESAMDLADGISNGDWVEAGSARPGSAWRCWVRSSTRWALWRPTGWPG